MADDAAAASVAESAAVAEVRIYGSIHLQNMFRAEQLTRPAEKSLPPLRRRSDNIETAQLAAALRHAVWDVGTPRKGYAWNYFLLPRSPDPTAFPDVRHLGLHVAWCVLCKRWKRYSSKTTSNLQTHVRTAHKEEFDKTRAALARASAASRLTEPQPVARRMHSPAQSPSPPQSPLQQQTQLPDQLPLPPPSSQQQQRHHQQQVTQQRQQQHDSSGDVQSQQRVTSESALLDVSSEDALALLPLALRVRLASCIFLAAGVVSPSRPPGDATLHELTMLVRACTGDAGASSELPLAASHTPALEAYAVAHVRGVLASQPVISLVFAPTGATVAVCIIDRRRRVSFLLDHPPLLQPSWSPALLQVLASTYALPTRQVFCVTMPPDIAAPPDDVLSPRFCLACPVSRLLHCLAAVLSACPPHGNLALLAAAFHLPNADFANVETWWRLLQLPSEDFGLWYQRVQAAASSGNAHAHTTVALRVVEPVLRVATQLHTDNAPVLHLVLPLLRQLLREPALQLSEPRDQQTTYPSSLKQKLRAALLEAFPWLENATRSQVRAAQHQQQQQDELLLLQTAAFLGLVTRDMHRVGAGLISDVDSRAAEQLLLKLADEEDRSVSRSESDVKAHLTKNQLGLFANAVSESALYTLDLIQDADYIQFWRRQSNRMPQLAAYAALFASVATSCRLVNPAATTLTHVLADPPSREAVAARFFLARGKPPTPQTEGISHAS